VRPLGYFLSVVTLALPICAAGLIATGASLASVAGFLVLAGVRIGGTAVFGRALHFRPSWGHLCLVPVRDLLSLAIWAFSFLGGTVYWSGQRFRVDREGRMIRVDRSATDFTLEPEETA
jgi:ceramide glucosyltransferase